LDLVSRRENKLDNNIPKITDAEWKVMDIVWNNVSVNAKNIVEKMKDLEAWNKNTTYTVLNRLIEKGAIKREEPSFICQPLIRREDVSITETRTLLEKMYEGSIKMLVKGFLAKEKLSKEDIDELKKLVERNESKN
jgi:BlaI family penicillinase repressor